MDINEIEKSYIAFDNYITRLLYLINKDMEDDLIRFLRKNGYRPRRTEKYMKNLKKRLKRKGLEIKCEQIQEVNYKDGSINVEYRFYFERIKYE